MKEKGVRQCEQHSTTSHAPEAKFRQSNTITCPERKNFELPGTNQHQKTTTKKIQHTVTSLIDDKPQPRNPRNAKTHCSNHHTLVLHLETPAATSEGSGNPHQTEHKQRDRIAPNAKSYASIPGASNFRGPNSHVATIPSCCHTSRPCNFRSRNINPARSTSRKPNRIDFGANLASTIFARVDALGGRRLALATPLAAAQASLSSISVPVLYASN